MNLTLASVPLSALLVAFGISACKKAPPPPVEQPIANVDAAPPPDPMAVGAKDDFGKRYSCPDDRITLEPRADIDPMMALASASELKPSVPSNEVRSDPDRYAKWKADQDAARENVHATYASNSMFEVSGCGHKEIFGCHPHRKGAAVYPDWADCLAVRGSQGDSPDPAAAGPKRSKGKANISLGTPGAKVFLVSGADRRELSVLPLSIEIDPAGDWSLVGTKPGYSDYKQRVTFDEGQTERSFVVTLQPIGRKP